VPVGTALGTVLLVLAAAAQTGPASEGLPHPSAEVETISDALVAAIEFRDLMAADYRRALGRFATPEVAARFSALDKKTWLNTDPEVGWSYFASSSLLAASAAGPETAHVAMYHPWSDLFLLTSWNVGADEPVLVDVELVLGEIVREPAATIFQIGPYWWTSDVIAPAAVGVGASSSIQAFERLFDRPRTWQEALPILDSDEFLEEFNYQVAAHRLLTLMITVDELRHPAEGEDPRLTGLRGSVDHALATVSEIVAIPDRAPQTLPETRELLAKIPAESLHNLQIVSYFGNAHEDTVFLVPPHSADWFLSLTFELGPGARVLSRIDLVPWEGFAEAWQDLLAQRREFR